MIDCKIKPIISLQVIPNVLTVEILLQDGQLKLWGRQLREEKGNKKLLKTYESSPTFLEFSPSGVLEEQEIVLDTCTFVFSSCPC